MYNIYHWENYESTFKTNDVAVPLGAYLHIQFIVILPASCNRSCIFGDSFMEF